MRLVKTQMSEVGSPLLPLPPSRIKHLICTNQHVLQVKAGGLNPAQHGLCEK